MTGAALSPLDIGSLELFGPCERATVLGLFSARDLKDFAGALGRHSDDLELQDYLAHLTWRAIRGRRSTSESRKDITRQLERLRAALAGLGDEAMFALAAQGADVMELASQATRAHVPDHNGRPLDTERHVLIATLRAVEKYYTDTISTYSYDVDEDWYRGPLFTMLRVIETAVARAQNSNPPLYDALAKSILRSAPDETARARARSGSVTDGHRTNDDYVRENWAKLSPAFRRAHNRLHEARAAAARRRQGAKPLPTTKPPDPA
jgi:hypothetical protein